MNDIHQLTYYSVPTDKTSIVDLSGLNALLIDRYLPTIAPGEHLLPLSQHHIKVGLFRSLEGRLCGAHAVILNGPTITGTFTVALTPDEAEALWRPFESFYLQATDHGIPKRGDWCSPKMPGHTPWVASFPLVCDSLEDMLLPRFAGTWAMVFAKVAIDEMNGCA